MKTARFHSDVLVRLFEHRIVVTMEDMKRALGTAADMTVFRKLHEIDYLSSYSHRGGYYTLRALAEFDPRGLWNHAGVRFSKFGTLVDTVAQFVVRSNSGCVASELAADLGVEVKQSLLLLLRAGRVAREQFGRIYVYTSPDAKVRRQQSLTRRAAYLHEPFGSIEAAGASTPDDVKAAVILFLSVLDERQRRLFVGLESLRLGRGGDRLIAEWTGMHTQTISRGRRELGARDIQLERTRKAGGGRPSAEKKRPI